MVKELGLPVFWRSSVDQHCPTVEIGGDLRDHGGRPAGQNAPVDCIVLSGGPDGGSGTICGAWPFITVPIF